MSLTRIYSLTKTLALTSAPAASRVMTRRKLFILTACCKMWWGWLPSLYNAMKYFLLFHSPADKKECKILTRHSLPVACSWHHTLTPCQWRSPMLHNCIPTLRRLPAKNIIILIPSRTETYGMQVVHWLPMTLTYQRIFDLVDHKNDIVHLFCCSQLSAVLAVLHLDLVYSKVLM